MCHFKKGFTLVELLIVIAIIGILAVVIISSLGDARESVITARIQTDMDSIAKRAAIENSQTFTYDTVCGSSGVTQSSVIAGLITSIETFASSTVVCNSRTVDYAVSVAINDAYWCIDSLGARREIEEALEEDVDFACPD